MRSAAFLFFGLTACSRATSQSAADAPKPLNSAAALDAGNSVDASIDAAVVLREDCAEPTKLTQLATVNDAAQFVGVILEGTAHAFDPETGASSAPGPEPIAKPTTSSRYRVIAGGRGLIFDEDDGNSPATVEDVATHKKIFTSDGCAAGGYWNWTLSTTGRFLSCISNRSGATAWDLNRAHKTIKDWAPSALLSGDGVSFAPSDTYAVEMPTPNRMTGDPMGDTISYFDVDKGTAKVLAKATVDSPDVPNAYRNRFSVAFCGDGALFVTSGQKEVVVYRGKDGVRLAGAPSMKGGAVSFSKSGKYISQTRDLKTTVFRLDQ